MDPTLGRMAVHAGMLLVVFSLISLILVDRNSFEFLLALAAFIISAGFLVAVSLEIRREVRMSTQ